MTPQQRWLPLAGLIALVVVLGWVAFSMVPPGGSVTWNRLKADITDGVYDEVLIEETRVRACTPAESEGRRTCVTAIRVPGDEGFIKLLDERGIKYQAAPPQACSGATLSFFLFPLLLLAGFWFFLSQRDGGRGGAAAFGRSSARLVPEEGTGVTFDDVAGVDEAAEELQEIVSFLKTPEKFTTLGGRPPKGVMLVGPPGTGKTLLARAVAGEAGVAFLTISGSDFVEMFVGVGAARVRDLFKTATEHAPCIIFIDELDAVGKARGAGGPAGNEEREQTLNQLLVELDGFDNRRGIIVMAATNRPETLDPALMRPGRFDRQVLVDRPDFKGRCKILEVHGRKLKLGDEVDLSEIARMTPGFAGADLANALNEAALLAARRGASAITNGDIREAIERVVAGLEKKSRRLSVAEKKVVAYHEVGHALCAAASPGADPVTKISIIPRGISALGYTMQLPLEDRYLMTHNELLNRLTVLYGGRAAEELVFGDVTTGAHDDIKRATDLARRMVTEFGMSESIGAVRHGTDAENPWGFGGGNRYGVSAETAAAIDAEIRSILDGCHERARRILRENQALLHEMSLYLIDEEVLEGEVMTDFLGRAQPIERMGGAILERGEGESDAGSAGVQAPPPPAQDLPPRASGE